MSPAEPIGVVLVGVGGHAHTHLAAIRTLQEQGLVRLLAVCDAAAERWADTLDALRADGVAVEPNLQGMLENWRGRAALLGAPVGIPSHRSVTVAALEAGYHVVAEKPPAGCIEDLDAMLQVCGQSGRACAVHFQGLWSRTVQQIKAAIVAGKIGRLREVRCKGRWLRTDTYYNRNRWAGKLRVDDVWVLDGTINNPFAHQINNGLFMAGTTQHAWANPLTVQAELYHARPTIAGDDTSCVHVKTDTGVDLRFWYTLCSGQPVRRPALRIIGEAGEATWSIGTDDAAIRYPDGRTEPIEPDQRVPSEAVNGNVCRYLLRRYARIMCTLADTRPFMVTVCAAYEVAGPPRQIDSRFVKCSGQADQTAYSIEGIDDLIESCSETGQMFSDAGAKWADPTQVRHIEGDYSAFTPAWQTD